LISELIHLYSVLSALRKFDIPEYEIEEWYENKHAEKWVHMFSGVKFYDERKAKPIGEYPDLMRIWDNPDCLKWH